MSLSGIFGIMIGLSFVVMIILTFSQKATAEYMKNFIKETALFDWKNLPIALGILAFDYIGFVVLSI